MHNRNKLVNELRDLLSRKQSREYYATRLGVTIAEINDMLAEIRGYSSPEETSNMKRVNIEKGEVEITGYYNVEPTPEQIINQHNIDTNKYKLSQFWSKQKTKGYQVSACFKSIVQDKDFIHEQFSEFLRTYKPESKPIKTHDFVEFDALPLTCLIINLQDAHYNKYDIKGKNDINKRFIGIQNKVTKIVTEAGMTSNLGKIIYTIGSDSFNSEWTGETTHGTPQTNVMDFHKSFEAICEHEISVISFLLESAKEVEILFVPGNHDQYAAWTLIKWLQAFFRNQNNLVINTNPSFSKYIKFGNSAICFNHGYKIKTEDLAHNFAMQFKGFSSCLYHYIFTGDKHTEHSKEVGGIKYFRLGSISKAVSNWDEENGYDLCKGEMTAFLIDELEGMTRTYYEQIKY